MSKNNDYEAMAKAMLNTPQGSKVVNQIDKISDLLKQPEGQKLAAKLSGENGETLKKAADAANKGDNQAAIGAVAQLLSTKEGAAFAKQIIEMMNKK